MDLNDIYVKPENQQVLHPRYYVEGVLFGAGVAPEIPMPDAWLTWTIAHHGQMQDKQQADEITDALFAYFKQCLAMMTNNDVSLPAYIMTALKDESNKDNSDILSINPNFLLVFGEDMPGSVWLSGLLTAHANTESVWQHAWKLMQARAPEKAEGLAKKLKHSLGMFSTFADLKLAKAQAKERGQEDFESKLPLIAKSLPSALQTYVDVSGDLAAYLPNQFETFVQKPN